MIVERRKKVMDNGFYYATKHGKIGLVENGNALTHVYLVIV